MSRPLQLLLLAGAVVGGCTTEPIPGRPAWDQHVMPLLQGRCNHCHGETVGKNLHPDTGMPLQPLTRMDVCRPTAPVYQDLGISAFGGAIFLAGGFAGQFDPLEGESRPRMPPPPDVPLSEYEYEVLRRWAKIAAADAEAACVKAVRNRPPTVTLLEPPKVAGEVVEALIEITDPDNDGILGKATLGPATIDIPGAGRRKLEFPAGTPTNATLGVAVTDGYDIARL
jgi:hypothetical protein